MPVMGSFWSWEQPFCKSSAAVVTWQQYTKFRVSKPVKISSVDSLRQAAFPWCADGGGLLSSGGFQIFALLVKKSLLHPLLRLSPPKAFGRHGSHQAACARPDVQNQGIHTLQSTAGTLNKWLLYTEFECYKLLCACSTKGKIWESQMHSCRIS